MRKKLLRSRSGFEKPESREEAIMQNILGASNVLEPAESNIEEILQAILYNTPYTKKAESEIEKILLAIKNNGTYDGEGESRDMKILIAILNDLYYTEEAESRIEELLIEWLYQRSSIKVIEGVPPLSFTAKGKPLTSWSIIGNTVQNGTPMPENPVEVQAVGDRTWNLLNLNLFAEKYEGKITFDNGIFDVSVRSEDMYKTGISVDIPANTTFSCENVTKENQSLHGRIKFAFDDNTIQDVLITLPDGTTAQNPVLSFAKAIIAIRLDWSTFNGGFSFKLAMLNRGSTQLPYEPYGYKIPVATSADGTEPITTPIYLSTPLYSGEVMRSDGTITRSDGTTETFTAPQIPTLNGTTVIDVDTAVKPSNVYIEYK